MAKQVEIPTEEEMRKLIGNDRYAAWKQSCAEIETLYEMESIWNDGGKNWSYEYKFRRGGKTLCTFYTRQDGYGLLIILGREEREKLETIKSKLAVSTLEIIDGATTYHDGQWIMFDEFLPINDLNLLLRIKRKPNKK